MGTNGLRFWPDGKPCVVDTGVTSPGGAKLVVIDTPRDTIVRTVCSTR